MSSRTSPLILTIDDEPQIRASFRRLLEDYDYEVMEAENGRIGLQLIQQYHPDLILVDMKMPELNGLQVMEEVARLSPDTPIIVISGAGEIRDVVKALHLGAWDYLIKPLTDMEMLVHTIEKSLERRELIFQNRDYQTRLEEKVKVQTKSLEETHKNLQESEKQYRTIVETAREGIWILDSAKQISFVTHRATEMFGYSNNEMLGQFGSSFVDPEFSVQFTEKLSDLFGGQGQQFDMKFNRKDGSSIWGIVSANPVIDDKGDINEGFVMILDITARKQAEDELARHKNHLEELVRLRTDALESTHKELVKKAHKAGMADIATDVVHNIGNVLNSVKTSVQIIENILKQSLLFNFKKANELLRENLDSIEDFMCNDAKGKMLMHYYLKLEEGLFSEQQEIAGLTDRLKDMVDAITQIVSAQQHHAHVDWLIEEADLKKSISEAVTLMQQQLDSAQVTVRTEYHVVPYVSIQRIKLLHTLINIIRNACESMKFVPVEQRILQIILDYADVTKDSVIIGLRDNGTGIATENLERIFSYGFTSKQGRFGLGLHSCANYMTEMGGKIWAENNLDGIGTTFFLKFRIPADQ